MMGQLGDSKMPSPSEEPRPQQVSRSVDPCEAMPTTGAGDTSDSQHSRLGLNDDSAGRADAQKSIRIAAIRQLGRWARGDDCEHGYYAAGGTEYCPACFPENNDG